MILCNFRQNYIGTMNISPFQTFIIDVRKTNKRIFTQRGSQVLTTCLPINKLKEKQLKIKTKDIQKKSKICLKYKLLL